MSYDDENRQWAWDQLKSAGTALKRLEGKLFEAETPEEYFLNELPNERI